MKSFLLVFLPLFFSFHSNFINAQNIGEEQKEYDLIGTLLLENGGMYSYRIMFDRNKKVITGFSYTDINGPDETKSRIIGTYDKKKKIISFEEREILYTKSSVDEDNFCFVNVTTRLKLHKKKQNIKGEFTGLMSNGDTCAVGKIHLISLKTIEKKVKKLHKKIKKKKKIDQEVKDQLAPETFLNNFKPSVLKVNDKLSVFWKSDHAIIEVWDSQREDGDKIVLFLNGKKILYNYEIKNAKKLIHVDLKQGKNKITIKATDVGSKPPNTTSVNLIDGNRVHKLVTSLQENETTTITIIRK